MAEGDRKESKHVEDDAIRAVLGSREGRVFTRMVLRFLEWNEDVFTADPTALAARVGRQSAGVTIYRVLNERHPELVARMLVEERERHEAQARGKHDGSERE